MNSSTFSTLTPATDAQNETLPFFTPQQAEDVLGWTEESFKSCRKPFAHQRAATRKARHAYAEQGTTGETHHRKLAHLAEACRKSYVASHLLQQFFAARSAVSIVC